MRIVPEKRSVLVSLSGRYRVEDCRASTLETLRDPTCEADFIQLVDASGIEHFDADYRDISSLCGWLANRATELPHRVPFIIIAPDDVQFGMARMFQQLLDGRSQLKVLIARSRAEAARLAGWGEDDLEQALDTLG